MTLPNEQPDKYLVSWWEQRFAEVLAGYRGATHGINRAQALYDDFLRRTTELAAENEALRRDRDEDRATIGELRARVDRMAEFLNTLRKGTT